MGCSSSTNAAPINYGVHVGPEVSGETRALRHPESANNLMTATERGHTTIYEAYIHAFSSYGSNPCFGTRKNGYGPYEWKSYSQVNEMSNAFGKSLFELVPTVNVDGEDYQFVGVHSKNRLEWMVADVACALFGLVNVPFYDTLGEDTITYILNQTEMQVMICSGDITPKLVQLAEKGEHGKLKHIIQMEDVEAPIRSQAEALGITLHSMNQLIEDGKGKATTHRAPGPKDVYTFSYTSGTTGDSKGAMLTHNNMMAMIGSICKIVDLHSSDIHLSYLPLPHVFERLVMLSMFYNGCRIGFFQGDVLKLKDDLAELRPTIFPSVPRLWMRMYDVIMGRSKELKGCKASLVAKATAVKLRNLTTAAQYTHGCYDALVFKKMKAFLGGRVRICVTGSAPVNRDVLNFLKVAFCCPIIEAYGLTESTAAATGTRKEDPESGHVGGPIHCVEIKLVDVPDMNYTSHSKDEQGHPAPAGEICLRGPTIIKGYFKMPEKTAETVDSEGWMHTGDVGVLRPNGSLKIVDRVKNIFKLSQGEYVAPEKIENVINQLPVVAQTFLHGDSLQDKTVVIIVPDPDQLANAFPDGGDYNALCAAPEVKKYILEQITNICRENKLKGFEIPKACYAHNEMFSVENGLFTPTFKLKRPQAAAFFVEQIKAMYA